MGGYGSGRTGGRPTTESGLTLTLSKLLRDKLFRPGSACYSSTHMDGHLDRRAYRLDRLRSASWAGPSAGAAKVHDDPMGRGEARIETTGSSSRQTPTFRRAAVVVHMPADRRPCERTLPAYRRLHFRVTPGLPARIRLPARIARDRASRRAFKLRGKLGGRAALATSSPNRSGCVGQPTNASSRRSSPLRKSLRLTWARLSTSSSTAWRVDLLSTVERYGIPPFVLPSNGRSAGSCGCAPDLAPWSRRRALAPAPTVKTEMRDRHQPRNRNARNWARRDRQDERLLGRQGGTIPWAFPGQDWRRVQEAVAWPL